MLIFCVVAMIAGCWADRDYEYIALIENMRIVEYGKTRLGNVRNHSDMPIKYVRERDQYILYGVVDPHSTRPAMIFFVEGKTLSDAHIKGTHIPGCAYSDKLAPADVNHYGYPAGGFRFTWNPAVDGHCKDAIELQGDDSKLDILILDGLGQVVAEEEVLFEIVVNGIYRTYDGL